MNIFSSLRRKVATALTWRPACANAYEWLKACAVFATGRRGGALSRLVVPIRLAGQTQPVFLRCGSSDAVTLHEVFIDAEYQAVLQFAPHKVRGILDLGANVGLASRWFLQAWPSAQIVAVEPNPGNVKLLRRNLQVVGHDSTPHRVFHAFVGGWSRDAVLQTRGEGFANEGKLSSDAPIGGQPMVPVLTPAQLLEATELQIDLVKIDVEGAEQELLEGDLSWLKTCSIIALEIHDPLDESWLAGIVKHRLSSWSIAIFETRHRGAHLAVLTRGVTCA